MLSLAYLGGALLLAYAAVATNRRLAAQVIVAICLLSNLASIVIYYLAPNLSRVNVAVATRELAVYSCFALSLLIVRRLRWPLGTIVDKVFLVLLVFFATTVLVSIRQTGVSALLMGRELIFPLAVYFLFRFLNLDERGVEAVLHLVIWVAVPTALLALVEQVYVNLVDPQFWNRVMISGYLGQKYGAFSGAFPLSWVNFLPVFLGLPPTLRSIGLMLDPLSTGHFLAGSLPVVYYWTRGWLRYPLVLIVAAGAMCTFSKATMLIIFMVIGSQAFRLKSPILRNTLLGGALSAVVAAALLLLSTGDDNFTHFGSFKAGLTALQAHPFGNGVGSTGYFNLLVTGSGAVEAIDTTFSVYIYQMGWPGLLALVGLALTPTLMLLYHLALLRANGRFQADLVGRLLMTALPLFCAYSILAFASAAAYAAVAVFLPMALLGSYATAWVRLRADLRRTLPVAGAPSSA